MRRTVWKYPLTIATVQAVELPRGAKLLHVGAQVDGLDERPVLWAEFTAADPETITLETRTFYVFGTGHVFDLTDGSGRILEHIGTVMLAAGRLVLHVYEAIEDPPF